MVNKKNKMLRPTNWLLLIALVSVCGCADRNTPLGPNTQEYLAIRATFDVKKDNGPVVIIVPVGFADLTGSFRVEGTLPDLPMLTPDKNVEVCGTSSIPSPELVTGPNQTLANVLVYLHTKIDVNDPKWVSEKYDLEKNPSQKIKVFDQQKCVFLDRVFAIRTNQTMRIKNSDPVLHNTALKPTEGGATTFDQSIPAGSHIDRAVGDDTLRPFRVACAVHPWMSAWMITRKDPYFAKSQLNGTFKIEQIPAGSVEEPLRLEFRVWHEGKNVRKKFLVSATVNGKDQKWTNSGKIKLDFVANQTLDLKVRISADAFK